MLSIRRECMRVCVHLSWDENVASMHAEYKEQTFDTGVTFEAFVLYSLNSIHENIIILLLIFRYERISFYCF